MTAIELRFPAHRYHGTLWGRHVNEGVPEWPPSPYRLLRALYDTWQRKCTELPEETVHGLLAALAEHPPVFRLPKAAAAHTRSYLSTNMGDPTEKSLIFDAFVAVPPNSSCIVEWPTELTVEQRVALASLLACLNYLGRSESWIEARLATTRSAPPITCAPASPERADGDLVHLPCAVSPGEYKGKTTWCKALISSTADVQKERRSSPPAMRIVPYVRPHGALTTYISPKPGHSGSSTSAVMLALDAKVLPLAKDALKVAEQIRRRLMGIHRKLEGDDPARVSPLFSGKDREGVPLQGHQHLFILPESEPNGRIRRVRLFARSRPFTGTEIRALLSLRELYGPADSPIRCAISWRGDLLDPSFRPAIEEVISTTPFMTACHWRKGRGTLIDFLINQIRTECGRHGLPNPIRVEPIPRLPGLFHAVEYCRTRKRDPSMPSYAFRLSFGEPVPVPFTIGYGCHFGMGQFAME